MEQLKPMDNFTLFEKYLELNDIAWTLDYSIYEMANGLITNSYGLIEEENG